MPARPRRRTAAPRGYRPAQPDRLAVYDGADWGAPAADGYGPQWEAAHQAAYLRFLQAVADWRSEFWHLPVDPASVPSGDAAFCGELAPHECCGAECPARPPRVRRAADSINNNEKE